uniref:adenine phosphoribosyltransferase n=1 Tax=Cucumis melo TaxID=3656 RepID=A0A9I9CLP5_CUCME
MSAYRDEDPRIHGIRTKIRVVPDFPQPGIMFQDITTLLLDPKAFKDTIDLFVERYKGKNISINVFYNFDEDDLKLGRNLSLLISLKMAGSILSRIEARGFIFGPPIALAIGAKFIPLRKPRKLPEYGSDCLEMHVGAVKPHERALVVDDLIATGGTLCAAMNLLVTEIEPSNFWDERAGAEVIECACVIELPVLKGRERLNDKPLFVLVEYQ